MAFFLCANPYQPGEEMLTQLTIQVSTWRYSRNATRPQPLTAPLPSQHNSDDLGVSWKQLTSPDAVTGAD